MSELSNDQILALDAAHVWHPYSSARETTALYAVHSANGVRLTLEDGREVIDGMSSWWSAIHGYNHPLLNEAAKQQIDKMSHVMFGGLTHAPAVELCKLLVSITPAGLHRVFLSDSGSVAVEVAIKMALQYWYSRGNKGKNRLATIRSGYHGDTFGAMAVCDPVTGMHHLFSKVLPQHYFADRPECLFDEPCTDSDIAPLQKIIEENHQTLAAVILEPVVQGTGGMHFYSPQYLERVRYLCDQYDVLLILDEIATGFGRTGKLFASEYADISPDILCVGKALTGGYLSLAATLCNDRISHGISDGEAGVFMHGPTFMGNPLACSVACASIKLLLSQNWQKIVHQIEQQLCEELEPARTLPNVADVRVLGAIGVIETKEPIEIKELQEKLVKRGVWLRPFGTRLYTMPPYIIHPEDLSQLTSAMVESLKN